MMHPSWTENSDEIKRLREVNTDLLAALQNAADQLQHYLLSADDDDDAESAYQHARAAIARATSAA